MMADLARDGWQVFGPDRAISAWADAAKNAAQHIDFTEKRHGGTWFVGVDALPNAADGSVAGIPLGGPWQVHVKAPETWHSAQLSVIYPGYPKQDATDTDAAHRFRLLRDAAHMDGLLPEGPDRRRHLREPHGFILGIPLTDVAAAPLVVWSGSHRIMKDAFQKRFEGVAPRSFGDEDVTEAYQAARRTVFGQCERTPVAMQRGQAVVMDRHLIHGVAPWQGPETAEGRMVAYFRPVVAPGEWL